MSSIIINANTPPSAISFKQTVAFSTLDQNNSNAPFSEGYVVSGPVIAGVTPISIAGGTKCVIPLTTSTGNGQPFIKITFPSPSDPNHMYLTYCVAANNMADGYYDYKTGVPTSYMTALKNWINLAWPSSGAISTNKLRSLRFSFYGNSTNKTYNTTTFVINFAGTFGGGQVSATPTIVINA